MPYSNKNNNDKISKFFFWLSWCGTIVTAILFVVFSLYTAYSVNSEQNRIYQQAKKVAGVYARQLSKEIGVTKEVVNNLAKKLNSDTENYDKIPDLLREIIKKHPIIYGLGIAFSPYKYRDDIKLYAPYIYRDKKNNYKEINISDLYDYTATSSAKPNSPVTTWYHVPLEKGAMWLDPFFGFESKTYIAEYSKPLYRANDDNRPVGVIFADLSLGDVRNRIARLNIGKLGYGFIYSKEGTFVSHPNPDVLGQPIDNSIKKLIKISEKNKRKDIFTLIKAKDELTGQEAWYIFQPIPGTKWVLGLVLDSKEMQSTIYTDNRVYMIIDLFLLASFAIFASMLIFRAYKGKPKNLWLMSMAIAVIFVLASVYYANIPNVKKQDTGVKIYSVSSLSQFWQLYGLQNEDLQQQELIYIPVGLFIQHIKFPSEREVGITGYIWHKYSKKYALLIEKKRISKLFLFPQQTDKMILSKAYHHIKDDVETIGWRFTSHFRHFYSGKLFPFDKKIISIRLWHKDFYKNVFLIPDLSAYDLINPEGLPGIDKNLVLKRWHVKRSYYSYKPYTVTTNFGNKEFKRRTDIPDLTFNIELERKLTEPVVTYFMPLMIVTILVFLSLVSNLGKVSESMFTALTYSASLLFVLTITHIALRREIQTPDITFIEYCYILMYIFTVFVVINNIFVIQKVDWKFIQYRNNLIPKLFFWPSLTLCIMILTIVMFSS